MTKFAKSMIAVAVIAVIAVAGGYGYLYQKQAKDSKKITNVITKLNKESNSRLAPQSPLYKYANYLKKSNTPAMTPQIIAEFEEQAKKFKLPAKDLKHDIAGIWVFNSNKAKGAAVQSYHWVTQLENHHATSWVKNGHKVFEKHLAHISIQVNTKTHKIIRVWVFVNNETKAGKSTKVIVDKK